MTKRLVRLLGRRRWSCLIRTYKAGLEPSPGSPSFLNPQWIQDRSGSHSPPKKPPRALSPICTLTSRHRSRLSFYFLLKIRQSRHVQEQGSRAVSSWPGEFTGWGPDSRLLIEAGHELASESHPPLPRKLYVYHPQRSPILMREESAIKLCHFDIGASV